MGKKVIIVLLAFGVASGCMMSPEARQAKVYRTKLEAMLGKDQKEVTRMIREWEFDVLDTWEAEDPDRETIRSHQRPTVGFTEAEEESLFSSGGKYRVILFTKKVRTDSATLGSIDSLGRSFAMDTGYTTERFTIIRTVFRDGVLVNVRVWADVSQTSISGQKVYVK